MKKEYIKPTANIYLVSSLTILAGSVGPDDGNTTGEGPVDGGEDNNFSKGGSHMWDYMNDDE